MVANEVESPRRPNLEFRGDIHGVVTAMRRAVIAATKQSKALSEELAKVLASCPTFEINSTRS